MVSSPVNSVFEQGNGKSLAALQNLHSENKWRCATCKQANEQTAKACIRCRDPKRVLVERPVSSSNAADRLFRVNSAKKDAIKKARANSAKQRGAAAAAAEQPVQMSNQRAVKNASPKNMKAAAAAAASRMPFGQDADKGMKAKHRQALEMADMVHGGGKQSKNVKGNPMANENLRKLAQDYCYPGRINAIMYQKQFGEELK